MIIPFKQYLASESRILGIKPHTLYMRIVRRKHELPPVQRDANNRIRVVESTKPEHTRWMQHDELVQAAKDAVRAVYADQSVDREQVIESLDEIGELVAMMIIVNWMLIRRTLATSQQPETSAKSADVPPSPCDTGPTAQE